MTERERRPGDDVDPRTIDDEEVAGVLAGLTDAFDQMHYFMSDLDGNELELYIDVPGVDWRAQPELLGSPVQPLQL